MCGVLRGNLLGFLLARELGSGYLLSILISFEIEAGLAGGMQPAAFAAGGVLDVPDSRDGWICLTGDRNRLKRN